MAFVALAVLSRSVAASSAGLIGWWTLNETSGIVAHDSSGNGNDGMISQGVVMGIPGARGTAFGFSSFSVGSWVDVPYGTGSLAPASTQITVSAWINPADLFCGGFGQCAIASNEPTPGSNMWGYGIRLIANPGPTLQFCWGTEGGPGNCAYGDYTPAFGEWASVIGTYDGAVLNEYVNGLLVASQPGVFPALNTTSDFFIGRLVSGNLPFDGGIDDVRVYNRVLSAAEIANQAQQLPSTKDNCKNYGFQDFGVFKNQGDCVSFVATGGRNKP
jgi:hypothetical protein